jgi:probable phosphoglycerate mutase
VDRVIAKARAMNGNIALFAHGHIFRTLAARWLGLPPQAGAHFLLDTATLSVLSYYRGVPAVKRWNAPLSPESVRRGLRRDSSVERTQIEKVS